MHYFVTARNGSTNHLRVHPLFLSLTAAFAKCEKSPDFGSVSENDPRTLSNDYYTSPSDLPPLNIHFPGQNGTAYLSDMCSSLFSSVALCRECMVSQPQVNAGAREVEPNTSLPATNAEHMTPELVDNTAGASDSMIEVHTKGKKRQCASSGNVNSESHLMALSKAEI
jgi:hypothetical protein